MGEKALVFIKRRGITLLIVFFGVGWYFMTETSDWSKFPASFLATSLGVALGISGSLWLNRRREKKKEKIILSAIINELNVNLRILKAKVNQSKEALKIKESEDLDSQMEFSTEEDIRKLQNDLDFIANLMTEQWDIISHSDGLEIINVELLKFLPNVYYSIKTCNEWIRLWREAKHATTAFSLDFSSRTRKGGHPEVVNVIGIASMDGMWVSLLVGLQQTYKSITDALPKLEEKHNSL